MKILLLVHVEETFRHLFPKFMLKKILRKVGSFDRVIHFNSCINDYTAVHELQDIIDETIDWGWGYYPDEVEPEESPFVIDALGHEYTWIPPEMRDCEWLKNAEIYLGGGCDGECLQDMQDILDHLDIDYQRVPEFIYRYVPEKSSIR